MARIRSSKVGIGALAIAALFIMLVACVLFELGASPLGYGSLTSLLGSPPAEDQAAGQRYGKMRIRADRRHCREYSLDNESQKIRLSGTVVCNPEDDYAHFDQRSRAEIIRDAFRGQ